MKIGKMMYNNKIQYIFLEWIKLILSLHDEVFISLETFSIYIFKVELKLNQQYGKGKINRNLLEEVLKEIVVENVFVL
jgi:hypothetical protein